MKLSLLPLVQLEFAFLFLDHLLPLVCLVVLKEGGSMLVLEELERADWKETNQVFELALSQLAVIIGKV